eukprot:9708360-Alexandrium_andersonii.AAC.1
MGLGPTGLAPEDSAILTAHMLRRQVAVLHEIATVPTTLAKLMVWAMVEETWREDTGNITGTADRRGV